MKKKANDKEIILKLDSYNDIFSDFDPRAYSQKALSVDFLDECRRASYDKEAVDLVLLAPKSNRKNSDEENIKKRLKEHFNKHFKEKKEKIIKMRKEGVFWFVIGVIMVFISIQIYQEKSLFFNIIFIVGFLFMGEGIKRIFVDAKEKKSELDFYQKMVNAEISFLSK